MTDQPPLTLAHIEAHQDLKGARKYPQPLADAGLSVGALALHGLEELVDLRRYLMLAGVWTFGDEDWHADLVDRLLPIADHPKPLPPDVPTLHTVYGPHGHHWQLGDRVVWVFHDFGRLLYRYVGDGDRVLAVDPTDPRWLGPVPMRAVRS